jgi:hypothetical protein
LKKTIAVAGFRHVCIQVCVTHGPPKLGWIETERDRRRAHHGAEDGPHDVVERSRRSDLYSVGAREIEALGGSREIVV